MPTCAATTSWDSSSSPPSRASSPSSTSSDRSTSTASPISPDSSASRNSRRGKTVIKRLLCAALFLATALPTYAGFGEVARAIDRHHGMHRRWLPGLGIARFLVWVVRPKGVHDFQLVTYEGRGDVDAAIIARELGDPRGVSRYARQ